MAIDPTLRAECLDRPVTMHRTLSNLSPYDVHIANQWAISLAISTGEKQTIGVAETLGSD